MATLLVDRRCLKAKCIMDGSGEGQMMARWLGEVQVRSNLKSILSLTLVDEKLVLVTKHFWKFDSLLFQHHIPVSGNLHHDLYVLVTQLREDLSKVKLKHKQNVW